jgi:hypothetical protein
MSQFLWAAPAERAEEPSDALTVESMFEQIMAAVQKSVSLTFFNAALLERSLTILP